jgi:flagellar basal-body rod modification protein FlgD
MASVTGATSAIAGTSPASGSPGSGNRAQIANNFQSFLTLLTTQLKNQSPLDPLDTNQFTQQLVQFASVEQQLKTNETLTSLLASSKASTTSSAAAYIGMNVTADGTSATLSGGSASWTLTPTKAAAKATITIKDESGAVVATKTATLKAGEQQYKWDGKGANGVALPDGTYKITVDAADASGQPVAVATELSGPVTAVNVSGQTPILTVGTTKVPLTAIKTIAQK